MISESHSWLWLLAIRGEGKAAYRSLELDYRTRGGRALLIGNSPLAFHSSGVLASQNAGASQEEKVCLYVTGPCWKPRFAD